MKKFLFSMVPSSLKEGVVSVYNYFLQKPIINLYKTSYQKNVLLSYITYPFVDKSENYSHTNYTEARVIARVFSQMGYNVDVYPYEYTNKIQYDKYDVIFGFGDPLCNYFSNNSKKLITIYYGTGMHIAHQNFHTLKRVRDVYEKTSIWMAQSGRVVRKAWSEQTMLVDAMIVLGNEIVRDSYCQHYLAPKNIQVVPGIFYKVCEYREIIDNKDFFISKQHFLWFGSSGLIHKGLDLLLEYFREHPNLHLHVCGNIDHEVIFKKTYFKELYNTENIHTYGFIDLKSSTFKQLLQTCAFVIYPSCSEGGALSVVSAIVNGGLIPIAHKFSSIDIVNFGFEISDFSYNSIDCAVTKALSCEHEELRKYSGSVAEFYSQNYSIDHYETLLKKYLCNINI